MATNFYADQLRKLQTNPGGFTGSPGAQWGMDQGLEAVGRKMVGGRGSGGAMAALVKYGVGAGTQDYGNEFNRLLAASGQTDQTNLATDRLALDDRLGTGNLDIGRTQAANALTLGQGAQDVARRGQTLDYGLGMTRAGNDRALGEGQNNNTAQRNWWDYSLGRDQQAGTNARDANTNALNWFTANTNRGAAQSTDFIGRDTARRAWMPYGADPYNSQTPDLRPSWVR